MKNAKARRGYNFVCICCQRRGCAPIIFVGKARTGKIRRIKGPVPTVGPDLVPSPGSSGRQSTVRSLSAISTPALAAPVPVPVLCSPALAPAALSPALAPAALSPALDPVARVQALVAPAAREPAPAAREPAPATPALALAPAALSPALDPAALSPALDPAARAPAPAVPTPCQCGKSAVIRCSGCRNLFCVACLSGMYIIAVNF